MAANRHFNGQYSIDSTQSVQHVQPAGSGTPIDFAVEANIAPDLSVVNVLPSTIPARSSTPARLGEPRYNPLVVSHFANHQNAAPQTAWEKSEGVRYYPALRLSMQESAGFVAPDPQWVRDFCDRVAQGIVATSVSGDYPLVLVEIPVGMLSVAPYQRPVDDAKGSKLQRKMRNGFRPNIFSALIANFRFMDDGTPVISVMDGQGRATWVLRTHGPQATVPVLLYFGVPRHGENEFFEAQDKAFSRRLTPSDLLRSRLDSGDADAKRIEAIINELGLSIGLEDAEDEKSLKARVTALSEMEALYKRAGENILRDTLQILYQVWGDTPNTFTTNVVGGLGSFLRFYAHRPEFSRKRLITVLSKWDSPKELEQEAFRVSGNRTRAGTVGPAILTRYNSNLKNLKNVLPIWDVAEYEVDPASAKRKASARRRAAQDPQSPQSDTE